MQECETLFPLPELDYVLEYPVKLVTVLFLKEAWVVLCIINNNILSYEKLSHLPKAQYVVIEMRMALLENVKVNVWSKFKDSCISTYIFSLKGNLCMLLLFLVKEFVELLWQGIGYQGWTHSKNHGLSGASLVSIGAYYSPLNSWFKLTVNFFNMDFSIENWQLSSGHRVVW